MADVRRLILLFAALSVVALEGCAVSSRNEPVAECGHGVAEIRRVESASEGQNRALIVCKGGYVYESSGS